MNFFGDGGTTVFAPGGVLTFTTPTSDADVVIGVGYASYGMGETPYKPRGTPPTEWEILDSNLMALYATVDLIWSVPLDDAQGYGRCAWAAVWGWAGRSSAICTVPRRTCPTTRPTIRRRW